MVGEAEGIGGLVKKLKIFKILCSAPCAEIKSLLEFFVVKYICITVLGKQLEAYKGGGAKALSEKIATSARRRRKDGHDDDITVFVAVMEKAV